MSPTAREAPPSSAVTLRSLPAASFLASLDAEAMGIVEGALERVFIGGGVALCRQGDVGDALYIVQHGRLRAVLEGPDGHRRVLGEVGQGEPIGEISLLAGEPRSATVEAMRDTWLWKLPKEAFDRLADVSPRAMLALARLVARRTLAREAGRRRTAPPATLTLLPCGPSVDMRAFREGMLTALAPRRPVLVDHAHVDRVLGAGAANVTARLDHEAVTTRLLDDLESRHALVVYVADPVDNAWTRRCIRQADRLLRVVGGSDPGPHELEQELASAGRLNPTAREELVRVLPDDAARPEGTAAWLSGRAVDAHHHVRVGVPGDFERVARLCVGRPVGVALSGGGARGMAHVGLLRALEEAGVAVDVVAGTSAGAFVAAQYARGAAPDEIAERTIDMLRAGLFDPTLPLVSLLSGYRARRLMARTFGDAQLEDVWRPCHVVSADLLSASVVVHDRGPVALAVRASGSIPGVVPPVRWGEHLLVDGGVLNNLPADIVRARAADARVIASDVSAPDKAMWTARHEDAISGWRVLLDRLLGRTTPPRLGEVIMRASTLAAERHLATRGADDADVCFRPHLERFGTFDIKAARAIVETGYEQACRDVEKWLASGVLATDAAAPTDAGAEGNPEVRAAAG